MMKTLQAKKQRKEKVSDAREKLLDAAQDLMLSKGFAATTVDEICEKAKVTKGCFFHYFETKEDLGKELLERFCCRADALHKSFCGEASDPLERVYDYLDCFIKASKDPMMAKGCLLGTFAQELSEENETMRAACARGFGNWAKEFGGELAKAKAKYAPKASFNPRELAEHLIAILEGSIILAKARRDTKVFGKNLRHFKGYLKSLFKV